MCRYRRENLTFLELKVELGNINRLPKEKQKELAYIMMTSGVTYDVCDYIVERLLREFWDGWSNDSKMRIEAIIGGDETEPV